MPNLKPNNDRLSSFLKFLFTSCAVFIVITNMLALYKEIRIVGRIRRAIPYTFIGNKFLGLSSVLKDVKRIGYYTDKSLDVNQNAMQFAQAQYILAPIILDLNNTNYPFVLFDCSQRTVALEKIREAGLIPVKENQFGIILARNLKTEKQPKTKLRVPLWDKIQFSAGQSGH